MALPTGRPQRELDKFVETSGGEVAVRLVSVSTSTATTKPGRGDREFDKFVETSGGDVAIRVITS